MTWFCTRNIPILFRVQFLSFALSTTEKCKGRILTTFLGPSTTGVAPEQARLKVESGWPDFAPKYFGRILRTQVLPEQAKLKTGTVWLGFTPEILPHYLGCTCYCFPSIWLKNVSAEFDDFYEIGYYRSRQRWKPDPYDSVLHPKYTHTIWDAFLIVFHPYGWKMSRSNFDAYFRPEHYWSSQSWKSDSDDSVLHLKHSRIV